MINRKSRSNLLFVIFIITLALQCFMQIVVADEWDDEDENKFDSSESVSSSAQPVFTPKSEPPPPPPQPLQMLVRPQIKLEDFYREILIIALIVIYFINYLIGKRTNEGIAKKWMEVQYRLFNDNFAQVGTDTGSALIKDGPADFLFYLTGRRNCKFVHGRITLKPRHDLIQLVSNFITSQFSSNNITDTVTYQVHVDRDFDNFIFGITSKDKAKKLRSSRYDLGDFTRQSNNKQLPDNMCVHSESLEITDTILVNRVVELIKSAAEYLNAIIITDQPRLRPEKPVDNQQKLIILMCDLPDSLSQFEKTLPISELLMYLIDFIPAECTFRGDTKAKITKNREIAEKTIQKGLEGERQEAIQQKKADKKRAEAERIAKLSPDEQRKYEEKERKRELKKKQKKLIKKV